MSPTFAAQPPIAAGSYPQTLVAMDVNRDGIPDIVVADAGTNQLSVLLGNGQGGFAPSTTIPTSSGAIYDLAVIDVNADGLPDLVGVKDYAGDSAAVFLNNGKGSFTPASSLPTGIHPTDIVPADLNGDGRPDLVVANSGSATVTVFLNSNSPFGNAFGTPVSYAASAVATATSKLTSYAVAIADLNGDGKPDLVVTDYENNAIDILAGDGTGRFGPPTAYTGLLEPSSVAVADLNGDGRPDIIVGSGMFPATYILFAKPTGGFTSPATYSTVADVASIAVADLNGDGLLDVVVGGNVSAAVTALVNQGNGLFTPQTLTTGTAPESILATDVNGDGKADIVTANLRSDTVSVLLNTTPGPFQPVGGYGPQSQYTIAVNPAAGASLIVKSTGSTQTLGTAQTVPFADGTARIDLTGNAEEVARLYQAAFGRQSDLSGLNYWTDLIDAKKLGLANVASAFIGSSELVARYGALSSQALVAQLYQNVLGRPGESSGVAYWSAQLDSGAGAGTVLLGFSDSIENKDLTRANIGDKNSAEAYRLYQAALNRTPDAAGLDYWTAMLDHGATPAAVATAFMTTPEFTAAYAGKDDPGFVNQLYQNVLHRTPDANGTTFWTNSLSTGASRAAVLVGFSDSTENRTATAPATHDGWVFIHA